MRHDTGCGKDAGDTATDDEVKSKEDRLRIRVAQARAQRKKSPRQTSNRLQEDGVQRGPDISRHEDLARPAGACACQMNLVARYVNKALTRGTRE